MTGTDQARMQLSTLGMVRTEDADAGGIDERRLLLRFRDGDPAAFPAFVEAYRAPIYAYLVRSGVRGSERDDLFQEIFLKIHAAADQYRPERPLHPWLFTIVANTVRAHRRRERVRRLIFVEPSIEGVENVEVPEPEGDRSADARRTLAWVERQIALLPGVQRDVLILACIQRLPQKQVAAALKLPLNTVKTHLRRARLRLAQKLILHRRGAAS